jgi:hypothetical protein
MKRTLLGLIVPALVAAAVAIPSLASGSGNKGRVIDLTGVTTSMGVALDVKPKGDSPGDIGYVAGKLSKNGRPFGRYHGICFVIAKGTSHCTFTAGLPDGQLMLESSYGPGFNTGATVLESIVGGTGAYEGARGQGRDSEVGQNGLRFHLELLP